MKRFKLLPMMLVLLGASFAPVTLAYMEYTYTTDTLPWQLTLLNSEDYGQELLIDGGEQPAFSFSFKIPDDAVSSNSSTTFSLNDIDVWINPGFFGVFPRDMASTSSGNVSINPDGSVSFWDIVFSLNEIITPDSPPPNVLADYGIDIHSAGGANTCDCDSFQNAFNLTTQRPQNTWIVAATLDQTWFDGSDFSHWSVEQVDVPAPHTWSLLLAGLLLVTVRRSSSRRQRWLA